MEFQELVSTSFMQLNTQGLAWAQICYKTSQPKSGSFSETLNKELLASSKSKAEASKTTLDGTFQFRKSEDERKCNACRVCKNSEAVKCSACEITKTFEKQQTCLTTTFNNLPLTSSAFRSAFKMNTEEWNCEERMVRNNEESSECVECETTKKVSSSTSILMADNGFGDMSKSKSNIWQCDQCLVGGQNKTPGHNEKFGSGGGSAASTSGFKFARLARKLIDVNHTTATISNFTASAPPNSRLKLLPAQETASNGNESIFANAFANNAEKFTFVGSVGKFSFGSLPSNTSKNTNESKQATTALTTTNTLAIKSTLSAVDFGTQSSASTCDSGTFTENSSDNINKGSCNGTTRIQQGNVPTSVTSGFAFKRNSETILSTSDATTTTSVSFPSMAEQATNSQITSQAIFMDPAVQSSIDSLFFTSFVNTAKPAFNTGATVTQQSVYNFTGSSESMLTTKPHLNGDSTSTSRNIFMPASMPGDRLARKRRRKTRRIK
uniref:RanBP2-type domain-containing protein n=1 Tax=Glossina palpalis gambiensis TaxID=67801 RepID=A0A1B0B1P3_9MUSC